MKKEDFRCVCPITSALDILGDKWSLVIVKQMLFEGKYTFKDFVESPESIATNILSTRLKMLEQVGLLEKQKHPTNKKTNIYVLTTKGLDLTPLLIELTLWSRKNVVEFNPDLNLDFDLDKVAKNKETAFTQVIENYRNRTEILLTT